MESRGASSTKLTRLTITDFIMLFYCHRRSLLHDGFYSQTTLSSCHGLPPPPHPPPGFRSLWNTPSRSIHGARRQRQQPRLHRSPLHDLFTAIRKDPRIPFSRCKHDLRRLWHPIVLLPTPSAAQPTSATSVPSSTPVSSSMPATPRRTQPAHTELAQRQIPSQARVSSRRGFCCENLASATPPPGTMSRMPRLLPTSTDAPGRSTRCSHAYTELTGVKQLQRGTLTGAPHDSRRSVP